MPFQAWIFFQASFFTLVIVVASMGPCPFRHGYIETAISTAWTTVRFNGAMPFQAWIYAAVLSAVQLSSSASMGPCPFRHGCNEKQPINKKQYNLFNGSMPFQAWIRRTPKIPKTNLIVKYNRLSYPLIVAGRNADIRSRLICTPLLLYLTRPISTNRFTSLCTVLSVLPA